MIVALLLSYDVPARARHCRLCTTQSIRVCALCLRDARATHAFCQLQVSRVLLVDLRGNKRSLGTQIQPDTAGLSSLAVHGADLDLDKTASSGSYARYVMLTAPFPCIPAPALNISRQTRRHKQAHVDHFVRHPQKSVNTVRVVSPASRRLPKVYAMMQLG